jgi:hypothetical protein
MNLVDKYSRKPREVNLCVMVAEEKTQYKRKTQNEKEKKQG